MLMTAGKIVKSGYCAPDHMPSVNDRVRMTIERSRYPQEEDAVMHVYGTVLKVDPSEPDHGLYIRWDDKGHTKGWYGVNDVSPVLKDIDDI